MDVCGVWLSVWSKVQIVCIWSSWCHCRPKTPSSLALFESRLILPFWYRLTQIVLEKRPLNGCSSSSYGAIWPLNVLKVPLRLRPTRSATKCLSTLFVAVSGCQQGPGYWGSNSVQLARELEGHRQTLHSRAAQLHRQSPCRPHHRPILGMQRLLLSSVRPR